MKKAEEVWNRIRQEADEQGGIGYESRECLSDIGIRCIDQAIREATEEMRERCAKILDGELSLVGQRIAKVLRALPLSGDKP